ncbi:DUF6161 domain-containing protein [Leptospira interrogans]
MADGQTEEDTININVPEQGVSLRLTNEEAIGWIDKEVEFYKSCGTLLTGAIRWLNQEHPISDISSMAMNELGNIRGQLGARKQRIDSLDGYLKAAREHQLILSTGYIGRSIRTLIDKGQHEEARWALVIYSPRWSNKQVRQLLIPIRAAILTHPAAEGSYRLIDVDEVLSRAHEARDTCDRDSEALKKFIAEKQVQINALEDLYKNKLMLQEPAAMWKRAADMKKYAWWFWLSLFSFLVIGPLYCTVLYWETIFAVIKDVANSSNSNINIAGIAVISVPLLLYGWLLKNVSRVFVQTMVLSDDALLRHSLAYSFLGLAANKDVGISDNERALILNALFRPLPTSSTVDAGPPSGLLELIKGKGS